MDPDGSGRDSGARGPESDVDGCDGPGPDGDRAPGPQPIEPAAPESFGAVQVWWGDGKGKTTAALGLAMRAAGHGYRVHVLQFMKAGADSVEDIRGEYSAMAALPGVSYEHAGHYGWHRERDDDAAHADAAAAGLERARELLDGAADADLTEPIALDGSPADGVHMLVLDEVCYAANRGLVDPDDVAALVEDKPDALELVATGGHERPAYLTERADVVSEVRAERHHFDDGVPARRGTEY